MAYSQAVVLAGGIAHVPVLITFLKFLDSKTLKLHNQKAQVIAKEKEAAAKVAAAEKAAREKAEQIAKLEAQSKAASIEPPNESTDKKRARGQIE